MKPIISFIKFGQEVVNGELACSVRMYINSWDEFYDAAEKMFTAEPTLTRYSLKYNHKAGKVVLKVTNDKVAIKFRTDQQPDVKKIDKLNTLFLRAMTSAHHQATSTTQ